MITQHIKQSMWFEQTRPNKWKVDQWLRWTAVNLNFMSNTKAWLEYKYSSSYLLSAYADIWNIIYTHILSAVFKRSTLY